MTEETGSASGQPQASGSRSRQKLTGEDSTQPRRPLSGRFASLDEVANPITSRRRSSNISLDSINDARRSLQESTDDLFLPRVKQVESDDEPSNWQSAPLAFALLPAIGGMLFTNGSAVVSDVLLLCLAAVFLNWSVRLPWAWYRSAQELRKKEESNGYAVLEDSSDDGSQKSQGEAPKSARQQQQIQLFDSAVKELYIHELLALLCCYLFPGLGAYLLHSIRNSLSRPSEGLVSNYNLTIFLLAAELRPMSHLVKLIQARTLHLQRIVKDNPYTSVDEKQNLHIRDILERLEDLERRRGATATATRPEQSEQLLNGKQTAVVLTEVRRTMQPDLDALNRAVRRYEKRATLQTMQTESRLLDLEARLADAISLAAAAAKSGQRGPGLSALFIEWTAAGMALPFQAAASLARLPFATIKAAFDMVTATFLHTPKVGTKADSRRRAGPHSRSGSERERERGAKGTTRANAVHD